MRKKLFPPHKEFDNLNNKIFVKNGQLVITNAIVAQIEKSSLPNGVYDFEENPLNADQENLEVHKMIDRQINALDTDSEITFPKAKYLKRGSIAIRLNTLPDYLFTREHVALLFRSFAGKTLKVQQSSRFTPGQAPILVTVDENTQFLIMPRKKVDSPDEIEEIK